jgi:hypothetical protein
LVDRWFRPDPVRHASVTTAMQGRTATHHDTRRDSSKTARETGNTQLTGHFRWSRQVLGSNPARLAQRFTELLERLHLDKLDAERGELDGCRDAIDKATAVLLDQGKIGASLGLDSAVHAIGKATELARYRLNAWRAALDGLPAGPVEVSQIAEAFPGIEAEGGEFRAHLDLARPEIVEQARDIRADQAFGRRGSSAVGAP